MTTYIKQFPQNKESQLTMWFYEYLGGPPKDPDSLPTYIITDPTSVTLLSGSGVKEDTGLYSVTFTPDTTWLVNNGYKITWTAVINGNTVTSSTLFGIVLPISSVGEDVYVSNSWLNQVKRAALFPKIDKLLLSDDEIKEYCIKPSMDKYFIKFPIKVTEEFTLLTNSETPVPLPDAMTYGVIDVKVTAKDRFTQQGTGFWDIIMFQTTGQAAGGKYSGQYGIRGFNPNALRQTNIMRRAELATLTNLGTTNFRLDVPNKILYVYCSMPGRGNVTWAKRSLNFDDVKFEYQWDVIKLSQAEYMDYLASAGGMLENNSEVNINAADLRSDADKLRTDVLDRWKEIPDVIVLRAT